MRKFLSFLFCAAIGIPAINAVDYYVAPSGSDSNSGSKESPFLNIKTAINKAEPGTTIYMREGIYRPSVTDIMEVKGESNVYDCVFFLSADGTTQEPITLSGYRIAWLPCLEKQRRWI